MADFDNIESSSDQAVQSPPQQNIATLSSQDLAKAYNLVFQRIENLRILHPDFSIKSAELKIAPTLDDIIEIQIYYIDHIKTIHGEHSRRFKTEMMSCTLLMVQRNYIMNIQNKR